MNKRGQVYILAAIIVCMLAFLVVSKPNVIREQVLLQNFKGVSNNYLTESPKVVNRVLEENPADPLADIQDGLSKFTGDFVDNYARNQDPNIGLIYIYTDENGIVIHNFLNDEEVHFVDVGNKNIEVLLPTTEEVSGVINMEEAGIPIDASTPLCKLDSLTDYCVFRDDEITPGEYTLKIKDIDYKFEIAPESPELMVIIKSKDLNTVKVDVSESAI